MVSNVEINRKTFSEIGGGGETDKLAQAKLAPGVDKGSEQGQRTLVYYK